MSRWGFGQFFFVNWWVAGGSFSAGSFGGWVARCARVGGSIRLPILYARASLMHGNHVCMLARRRCTTRALMCCGLALRLIRLLQPSPVTGWYSEHELRHSADNALTLNRRLAFRSVFATSAHTVEPPLHAATPAVATGEAAAATNAAAPSHGTPPPAKRRYGVAPVRACVSRPRTHGRLAPPTTRTRSCPRTRRMR